MIMASMIEMTAKSREVWLFADFFAGHFAGPGADRRSSQGPVFWQAQRFTIHFE
jgi:hypothetical protein